VFILDETICESISLIPRGVYIEGRKVADSPIERLNLSDNPNIGNNGSRIIFMSLINAVYLEHVITRNIGMGPKCGSVIASSLRDVAVKWQVSKFIMPHTTERISQCMTYLTDMSLTLLISLTEVTT